MAGVIRKPSAEELQSAVDSAIASGEIVLPIHRRLKAMSGNNDALSALIKSAFQPLVVVDRALQSFSEALEAEAEVIAHAVVGRIYGNAGEGLCS